MIFTVSNFDVLQGVIEAVYLERKKGEKLPTALVWIQIQCRWLSLSGVFPAYDKTY